MFYLRLLQHKESDSMSLTDSRKPTHQPRDVIVNSASLPIAQVLLALLAADFPNHRVVSVNYNFFNEREVIAWLEEPPPIPVESQLDGVFPSEFPITGYQGTL